MVFQVILQIYLLEDIHKKIFVNLIPSKTMYKVSFFFQMSVKKDAIGNMFIIFHCLKMNQVLMTAIKGTSYFMELEGVEMMPPEM